MRFIVLLTLLSTSFDPSKCLYKNVTIPEVPVDSLETEEESEQELSSQLEEVDIRSNGWSDWSDWSPCSRSCDGGVSRQLRTCNTGKCRGEHVRYRICNMQPCPEHRDFRASQCSAFDSVPYESTLYTWQPHYTDDVTDPHGACVLVCKGRPRLDEDSNDANPEAGGGNGREYVMVVAKLAEKAHDGTRCRPGSLDMCIDGQCRRIGCDLRIDSIKQVDECGVCGGDGSSCSRPLYHWALTSSSLCSATCGGGYKMSRPVCKNRVTGDEVEEELCNDSQKPEPSVVECNTQNCPPKWFAEEWGPCTASCGGGTRIREVYCMEENNNTRIKVDDIKCGGHKPWFQDACNQMDCPTWYTTKWSGCSVSCGEGLQSRTVECRDSKHQLSMSCPPASKPSSTKTCSTGIHCPFSMEGSEELLPGLYHTQPLVQPYPPPPVPQKLIGEQNLPTEPRFIPDEWGPCSVTCGEGIKKREVYCKIYLEFSRTIAKLPDKQCSGPKPVEEEKCYMDSCDLADKVGVDVKDDPYTRSKIKIASGSPAKSYSWREQGYTSCSATCLGGIQEMIVNCVRDDTQKVTSPYMCPIELKPEIKIQTCNEHPCPPRWNYSEFSACSQSCGLGIQTREVNCIHEVAQGGGNALVVPNNMCPQPPPPDRQYCNVLDCPVRWKAQEWSRCSKSCGGGQKTRKVECKQIMAQNHTVDRPAAMCPQPKPAETKPCNTKSCIVDSDKPHIDVSNSTFIQHDYKKKKISLRIGGAATVFVGTTVKIKCPVKRYDRAKIQWLKDKTTLPRAKKFKVSKKGALRVSNLGFKDGGVYTCVAGKSSANIVISVKAKPGDFVTSDVGKQGVTDGSSTSGKKKAETKTRLFTPTLPSLRLDTSMGEQSTLDKNEQDRISHMPSSSSEYLNPPGAGTSSASKLMPNFHRLVSNLKYLWPFQTFSSSRGHRMIEFPRNSMETDKSPRTEMTVEEKTQDRDLRNSVEEQDFEVMNRGSEDMIVLGDWNEERQLVFEWKTSSWTKCTETCGGDGFQVRMARCLVRFHNTTQTVDSSLCEEAGLGVPTTRRKCGFDECPEWVAYEWSSCEKSKCVGLHKALLRRAVKCEIGRNLTVDPNKCESNRKPLETQDCHNERCVGKWKVGTWSECAAECGVPGNKYRIIQCVWYGTKKVAGTACKDLVKPPVIKNCIGPPCQTIEEPECSDQSMFCPNVKAMNMCRIKRYQQQCCHSCKD